MVYRLADWLAGYLRNDLAWKEFGLSHNRFPSNFPLRSHLVILIFRFHCVELSRDFSILGLAPDGPVSLLYDHMLLLYDWVLQDPAVHGD